MDETQRIIIPGDDHESVQHWWQNWRWLAAMAAVLTALALTATSVTTYRTSRNVADLTSITSRLEAITATNQQALDGLKRNQASLDELVGYVHQAQQAAASGQQSPVVQQILTILCATSDPLTREACGEPPLDSTGSSSSSSTAPILVPTTTTPCPSLPNGRCRP